MGMNKDICAALLENYVPEQRLIRRKKISIHEKSTHYSANVDPERETVVFVVDGNIIINGDKCDRLILSKVVGVENSWYGHFIELKGVNVEHAITQLEATIRHARCNHVTLQRKFARIIGRSFPSNKANPVFEKARARFRKDYDCELKCLKSRQPDKI